MVSVLVSEKKLGKSTFFHDPFLSKGGHLTVCFHIIA